MPRSKFLLVLALLFLLTVPVTVAEAQAPPPVPVLISAPVDPLGDGEGTAIIFDDQGLSDGVAISMTDVTAPPAGSEYVAWLVSDDQRNFLNIGTLSVGSDGSVSETYDSSASNYSAANLIHNYSGWIITVEDAGSDPSSPANLGVRSQQIETEAFVHVRHLLTNWPPGSDRGILTNLKEQLDEAIRHANLAIASDNLDDVKLHTHHVINIIEGEGGANFDASFGNPGDGIGVITHAQDRKHAGFAAAVTGGASGDGSTLDTHAELVELTGKNAEDWSIAARDVALQVIAQSDLSLARLFLGPGGGTILSYLEAARNGFDANGDGTIDSSVTEGAAEQAYRESQRMATFSANVGSLQVVGPPTATPTPEVPPTPIPTPTPAATATPVPTPTPLPLPQPTAPGLPGVGDESVPLVAQLALLASVALLAVGGATMIRNRRRNGA